MEPFEAIADVFFAFSRDPTNMFAIGSRGRFGDELDECDHDGHI